MAPLDHNARQQGKKAMEKALSPFARFQRRMKQGRPATLTREILTPLQAVHRLFIEAARADTAMTEVGWDPADVRCRIAFYRRKGGGHSEIEYEDAPARTTRDAIRLLTFLDGAGEPLIVLGAMWHLLNRDDKSDGPDGTETIWRTQYNSYPWNEEAIDAILKGETGGNAE